MPVKCNYSPLLVLAGFLAAANAKAQGDFLMRLGEPYVGQYGLESSYAFPSEIRPDGFASGDIDTTDFQLSYVGNVSVSTNYAWHAGLSYRQIHSSVPYGAPLPNNLYNVSLVLGNQWRFAEQWSLLLRLQPGLASDLQDVDWGDVTVPVTLLFFYDWKPGVTLFLGANFSYRRDIPVIPGFGARWRFAKDWTLLLVYPVPRIEYQFSPQFSTYLGVRLTRSNFRVSENFGDEFGMPRLNDEDVSYNDWRVALGARYHFSRHLRLTAEVGWMIDREYNYDDVDYRVRGDGAPFISLGLSGSY